jgi:hypothetical protein
MKDPAIRLILKETELSNFINDPHSKVVHELKLPVAKAIIDIAVINGSLHGYEIKSSSDTLQRLPNQLIAYSYIFDYITVVTERKYCDKIIELVPDWVGVAICSDKVCSKGFEVIKPSSLNLNKKGFYVAKLLWRDELVEILEEQQIVFRKKSRNWTLCEILSDNLELSKLSDIVREKLKQRSDWKIKEGYAVV